MHTYYIAWERNETFGQLLEPLVLPVAAIGASLQVGKAVGLHLPIISVNNILVIDHEIY